MIKNIQYLRFIAAFLVILAHANLAIYGISPEITNLGGFGVDIFFIISGFIIPYIIFGGAYVEGRFPKISASKFFIRRLLRIWPLYFLTILGVLLVSYLVESNYFKVITPDLAYIFNGSKLEWKWIFETLTFTHWDRPPLINIGWTLQFEFVFYFLIAFLLFTKVNLLQLEVRLYILLFVLFISNLLTMSHFSVLRVFSNPIVYEFVLGFYLYRLFSNRVMMSTFAAIIVLILSLPLFYYINQFGVVAQNISMLRPVVWGGIAFFIVWAALSLDVLAKESRVFILLGDSSYSLYLAHGLIAPLFSYWWSLHGFEIRFNMYFYLLIYIFLCVIVSVFLHLYVEKPIHRKLQSLL